MVDCLIIGAGISGLSAAHALIRQGKTVQVLEAGNQAGGLIRSDWQDHYLLESGPHTFPTSATELLELCAQLNLTPVPASPKADKRFLYLNRKLQALPHGPLSFLTSPVLSAPAKWRMLQEPFQPKMQSTDPTLAEFFTHRLGPEPVAHLLDPFISGIYAGNIDQLSAAAVFPKLWQWEQEAGSLIKGASGSRKNRKDKKPYALLSFKNGLGSLIQALSEDLPAEALQLNMPVAHIQHDEAGWTIVTPSGQTFLARQLILALPAYAAAALLQDLLPEVSAALNDIPYNSLSVVQTAFPKQALGHTLDGFGVLIPRREKLALLGSIWVSSLFPERCPRDQVLLANFIGGAHQPELASQSEETITAQVLADLQTVFQTRHLEPPFSRFRQYQKAIPQYTLGHRERVETIRQGLARLPGLAVCGNYLSGLALNECVKSGQAAAQSLS